MITKVVKKCGVRPLPFVNFSTRLYTIHKHNVHITCNKNKKNCRFIQKFITICLDKKMISLHLQHKTHHRETMKNFDFAYYFYFYFYFGPK